MSGMLTATIGDKDYSICFEYKTDEKLWHESIAKLKDHKAHHFIRHLNERYTKVGPMQPNVTKCVILCGPVGTRNADMQTIGTGQAVRCVLDQFNKEKGRKVALTAAVNGLEKHVRLCLWTLYLNRKYRQHNPCKDINYAESTCPQNECCRSQNS